MRENGEKIVYVLFFLIDIVVVRLRGLCLVSAQKNKITWL